MPLPAATAERKLLHTRTVVVEGFERADGLFDIDAWLTDIKTYGFPNFDRGGIKPGEPLHGMGLRLTIDVQMNIIDAVAVTDFSPYRICTEITPAYRKLIGLRIKPGFTKQLKELFGGVHGCTHLLDLLGPAATTAFQTLVVKRFQGLAEIKPEDRPKPALLNSCHTWSSEGPVIERDYPKFFTGPKKADAPAS